MTVNLSRIPQHMRSGVQEYLEHGELHGGFLKAVLENDLVGAFGAADSINVEAMLDWATFLYNDMPRVAWGSPENVEAWIEAKREEAWAKIQEEEKKA